MQYDLLVHVDLSDSGRFAMALGNIANYLAALPQETFQVVLLANGAAAPFLCRASEHAPAIQHLREAVSFRVCANALRKAGMQEQDVLPGVTIVPAGVVELVRLQREGFAYIKP